MMHKGIVLLFMLATVVTASAQTRQYDICIYGGTSAGVIAAYTARKQGKTVLLIEPGRHVGGMSSGGLGYTDIGNKYAISGLALDFYRRIGWHYGKLEQWTFEPKVAEALFRDYLKRGNVNILYNHRLHTVQKTGNVIKSIVLENNGKPAVTIHAKMFIDCSYEGDLMAAAGVTYTVGREDNILYGETINGVQLKDGHQFPNGIDPWKIPGDTASGLLWGISNNPLQPTGSGDKKVQAYNFRICLTNNPANRVPITKPLHYDPSKYELLIRLMQKQPWKSLNDGFAWSRMPGNKTDINNKHGFSTDMIGASWDYPEADYKKRAAIWQAHTEYTKGLLYFVGHDPRVPEHIRKEILEWGYPKDEYTDNGNWTHQLYIREARRMIGALVMTQHHCEGKEKVEDGVGMAAYTMDSHNCDRQVINGMVKNEGNVEQGGFGPYPVSYRAIIPKEKEVANLLVPVCLSATHIAYGSIRMEPVFMVLAQSAAVAAAMAIDAGSSVQQVNVKTIQNTLRNNPLADGSTPEILVDNNDTAHVKITGKWLAVKYGGYGPSYLTAEKSSTEKQLIQFIPSIVRAGKYEVYAYFPKPAGLSNQTTIDVFDGSTHTPLSISAKDVQVVGQTSGEWMKLGTYTLPAGNKSYVQISTDNADGIVVADAILFIPR
jgi:ribulose 1,5-bisphosphate synthetase/thiazole synthase